MGDILGLHSGFVFVLFLANREHEVKKRQY